MPQAHVTCQTTSTRLIEADESRTYLTIQNLDPANYADVFDRGNNTVGIRLYAHDAVVLTKENGMNPQSAWYGIANISSLTLSLSWFCKAKLIKRTTINIRATSRESHEPFHSPSTGTGQTGPRAGGPTGDARVR